jgi:hypothetical protein
LDFPRLSGSLSRPSAVRKILFGLVSQRSIIVALVVSHSRSAWLAAASVTVLLGYHLYKTQSLYRLKIPG